MKCAGCGKEYPLEELSFKPEVEEHIKLLALGKETTAPDDFDMNKLYCEDCLKKIS